MPDSHESDAREEQQHESQDDLPRDWPDDGQVGGHERTIGATPQESLDRCLDTPLGATRSRSF